jgi:hypothetical protein
MHAKQSPPNVESQRKNGIEEESERRRQGGLTGGSGSMWVKQHFSVFECVVDKKHKIIVSNPLIQ